MHFTAIFGFAVLLAGQGMVRYWPQAKPTQHADHAFPRAALALNIAIGGSIGSIPADQFLTVQDSGLTTQVRIPPI